MRHGRRNGIASATLLLLFTATAHAQSIPTATSQPTQHAPTKMAPLPPSTLPTTSKPTTPTATTSKPTTPKSTTSKPAPPEEPAGRSADPKAKPEDARGDDAGPSGRFTFGSTPKRSPSLVKRGIFDRPYLVRAGNNTAAVALGGYIDLVGGYGANAGISDGFSFEARRFNIFITSQVSDYVRMTSELEFEHGTSEIALETALIDILFHHGINLRGGIILVPLGKFNLAHDSPIYDVVDRPLVSTQIIPSTYSDVGFGFFGTLYPGGSHRLTYQFYLVNGLAGGVVAGQQTRLQNGRDVQQFASDQNGTPAITGRLGHAASGDAWSTEFGLSFYAGIYNAYKRDGDRIASPRWASIIAFDAEVEWRRLTLRGEIAYAHVEAGPDVSDEQARDQWGLYLEGTFTLLSRPVLVFEDFALNAVGRFDHIDLNANKRRGSGDPIGDETTRITLGLSARPTPSTALRLVYHHSWLRDALTNPTRAGAIQLGLASYF